MKTIELNQPVTAANDKDAELLRASLSDSGLLLINLMSAAGSGKTTLLSRTIRDLKEKVNIGVMEADLASDVDALSIEALGARSIQVHTGGCCHMDAFMTGEALAEFDTTDLDLLFLENVGNLICPAEYDTGAHKNVMILSVPEGDDKPLKYPLMFEKSDVLLITKTDALPYFDFDLDAVTERVLHLNPSIRIFPVSAKTGDGMDAWEAWLLGSLSAGEAHA